MTNTPTTPATHAAIKMGTIGSELRISSSAGCVGFVPADVPSESVGSVGEGLVSAQLIIAFNPSLHSDW